MSNIANKLEYLIKAKGLIKESIIKQGVDVPNNLPLQNYARCINDIKSMPNIAYGEIQPDDTTKLWVNTAQCNNVMFASNAHTKYLYRCIDPLPVNLSAPATIALGTKIYLFGGSTSVYKYSKKIYVLDTITNRVSVLEAQLPNALTPGGVALVGEKIYIFGGISVKDYNNISFYNSISVFDTSTNTLTTLSETLPTAMCEIATATVGGKIYLFGGRGSSSFSSKISIFDPETNTFTDLSARLPDTMDGIAAVPIGSYVYLFGGSEGDVFAGTAYGYSTDAILKFDVENEILTTLDTKLPSTASNINTVVIGNKIYLFHFSTIYVFDPTDEMLTSMGVAPPGGVMRYPVAAVNNLVYIFGTRSDDTECTVSIFNVDDYTTKTSYVEPHSISTLNTTLDIPSCGFGMAEVKNNIYLFGGHDGNNYLNTIYAFNTLTENLMKLDVTLPVNAAYFGVASIGTKVYLFGGYDGTSALNTIIVFNSTDNTITTLDVILPKSVYKSCAATYGTKVYLFGGIGDGKLLNLIQTFDTETAILSFNPSIYLPTSAYCMGAVTVGTKIYLIGGQNNLGYLNTIFVYDAELDSISTLKKYLPVAARFIGVVAVGKQIYLFGGYNGKYLNTTSVFHIDSGEFGDLHVTALDAVSEIGAISIGSDIYLFGGISSDSTYLNTIRRINVDCFIFPEHLLLLTDASATNLACIKSGNLSVQLGIKEAYAGSVSGIGKSVDAYLYVDGEWQVQPS